MTIENRTMWLQFWHRDPPAVRHATRFDASLCGCNPDGRQLLIPAGATLCFGLKTIAKSDPIPKPTKRNVIAEYKSYPLSFLARSISTSLYAFPQNYEAAKHFCGVHEPCHFTKALVFLPMHGLAVLNEQDISTASYDKTSRAAI
jgi:hypothetical protein